MTDRGSALVDKFEELAKECFAEYHGNLEDKVTAWCHDILVKQDGLKNKESLTTYARNRAIELLSKIQRWLKANNQSEMLLFPSYLEVKREDEKILVGDIQLGYLGADAITGKATMYRAAGSAELLLNK